MRKRYEKTRKQQEVKMLSKTSRWVLILMFAFASCGDDTSDISDGGSDASDASFETGPRGTLAGIVKDKESGEVIAGVKLTTVPASSEATTDSTGAYSLMLLAGDYEVEAVADGYEKLISDTVTINADQTTTLDLEMIAAVTYDSTCKTCHLDKAKLEASLEADPLPEDPGETGSTGEG